MSLLSHQDLILKLIDRGSWKHSWHLPKNEYGYVDWYSDETEKQVRKILQEDLDYITRISDEIKTVLKAIK